MIYFSIYWPFNWIIFSALFFLSFHFIIRSYNSFLPSLAARRCFAHTFFFFFFFLILLYPHILRVFYVSLSQWQWHRRHRRHRRRNCAPQVRKVHSIAIAKMQHRRRLVAAVDLISSLFQFVLFLLPAEDLKKRFDWNLSFAHALMKWVEKCENQSRMGISVELL